MIVAVFTIALLFAKHAASQIAPVVPPLPTRVLQREGDDDDDSGSTPAPILAPSTLPLPTIEGDDDDDSSGSELPVSVIYGVGFETGYDSDLDDEYEEVLDTSMTILSRRIVADIFTRRLRQRKLDVTIDSDAEVEGLEEVPSFGACPASVQDSMESSVECSEVRQSITLTIDDEDPVETEEKFSEALIAAICDGQLQDIIDEIYPDTDLFILPCDDGPGPDDDDDDDGGKGVAKKSSKKKSKKGGKKKSSKKSSKKGYGKGV